MIDRPVGDGVGQLLYHLGALLLDDKLAGHVDADPLGVAAQIGGEDGLAGIVAIEERLLLMRRQLQRRGHLLPDQPHRRLVVGNQLDVVGRQHRDDRRGRCAGLRLRQRHGQRLVAGGIGRWRADADLELSSPTVAASGIE